MDFSIQSLIVFLILLAAAGYAGFAGYRKVSSMISSRACETNCGCSSGTKEKVFPA